MSNDTRIYVVSRSDGTEPRLVRAGNKLAAMRHAVKSSYVAMLATQDELVRFIGQGIKVEDTDAESEQPEPSLFG